LFNGSKETVMVDERAIKDFFNRWAEGIVWAGTLIEMNYIHPLFLDWIADEIPLRKEDSLIDIGCGTGWLARMLSRAAPGSEVVATDISDGLVEKARRLTEKDRRHRYRNLNFEVAGAESIPYPDNHFDHAVSSVSFSFWSDPQIGLAEVRRVLKPGGGLYILDVCKGCFGGFLSNISNVFLSYKDNIYSREQYRRFFDDAGFTCIGQKTRRGNLLTTGIKG
jgi:ubiquinone/menaquinone biosynthesis C-methylase UbiE